MKTNIIGVVIALALAFAGAVGAWAQNDKVSEVRKVDAFSSIEVVSVATIYFTQSDTYSLKIEGKEKYVKTTTTVVKDNCLVFGFKDRDKQGRNRKEGVTVYLSAPDLKDGEFSGVGSFNSNEPLKLGDVKFQVEGVGKVNVKDLTCNK
ncbi:GIN domain-containing protein, partial [Bacteroides rodentium]